MRISDWSSDVCSSDLLGWHSPHRRTTAKGRGLAPPAFVHRHVAGDASNAYLTSTVAPAASRSFFIFAASSLDTPSFTAPPASVRSLASFRPRPVMARRSEEHTSELQSLMRISYA